jgi:hypothetical protein
MCTEEGLFRVGHVGLSSAAMVPLQTDHLDSAKQFHQILHRTVSLEHVLRHPRKYTPGVIGKLGVMLRRYSDECDCAGECQTGILTPTPKH